MSNPFGAATPAVHTPLVPASAGIWLPPQKRDATMPRGDLATSAGSSPPQHQTHVSAVGVVDRPKKKEMKQEYRGVRRVKIDSLVLLKILRHCRDHYPMQVNGQLLGFDKDESLEITNCFPLQNKKDLYSQMAKDDTEGLEEKVEDEHDRYQLTMVELMYELRADCFSVGWYQTMSFEDVKDKDIIDSLCVYQESISVAVVIGFDPLLNSMGRMPFRAYRVSNEFLKWHKEADEADLLRGYNMKTKEILVEVPLIADNPVLIDTFLQDWVSSDGPRISDTDNLQLDQPQYMEKSMAFVSQALDQLGMEQDHLMRHQRDSAKHKAMLEKRRIENDQRRLRGELPLPLDSEVMNRREAPSQLGTLLLSNRIGAIAQEACSVATDNLAKTYLSQERFSKT